MRRAANPSITPQMYRHFATVTVLLTAVVALFANGENEQAATAHAAESQAPSHRPAEPAKPAFRQADPAAGDTGTWGSDDGGSFGRPTMSPPASGASWLPPPLAGIGNVPRPLDSDDADKDLAADGTDPVAPTAEQIASAQAASRLRSSEGGSGD